MYMIKINFMSLRAAAQQAETDSSTKNYVAMHGAAVTFFYGWLLDHVFKKEIDDSSCRR